MSDLRRCTSSFEMSRDAAMADGRLREAHYVHLTELELGGFPWVEQLNSESLGDRIDLLLHQAFIIWRKAEA